MKQQILSVESEIATIDLTFNANAFTSKSYKINQYTIPDTIGASQNVITVNNKETDNVDSRVCHLADHFTVIVFMYIIKAIIKRKITQRITEYEFRAHSHDTNFTFC